MKLKINCNLCVLISICIILGEANYWAIYPKFFSLTTRMFFLVVAVLLPLFFNWWSNSFKLKTNSKNILACLPWILYLLIVIFNNQEFKNGGYFNTFRIIVCVLLILVGSYNREWVKKTPKFIFWIGFANVLATIIFFINSELYYRFMAFAYKNFQIGTANGLHGYRAALADHYSQNGTYISMLLITIVAVYMAMNKKDRNRRFSLVLSVMCAVALLLTTKRAHLIFSIAALTVVYYVVNPQKLFTKTFKLMCAAIALLMAFSIAIDFVPELAETFNRIASMGDDIQSTSRLVMWGVAFSQFLKNPIMGIGWYGFRYLDVFGYASSASGCHNIYMELLCETGLVGLSFFLVCAISSIISTVKNVNRESRNGGAFRVPLTVSLAIQTFVLFYGLTGNALYDTTFHFYSIAVMMNLAYRRNQRRDEYEKCEVVKQ